MDEPNRPAPPTGIRRVAFRLPIWLYRAKLGGLMGSRFVLIHHVGRKTGTPRQVVVEVVAREATTGAVTVAAGFGRTSDWYQNLLAHPDASIELGWRKTDVHAEVLEPEQSGEAMLDYAKRHPKAAQNLSKFMGYEADGTQSGYREIGANLPMLRLTPR